MSENSIEKTEVATKTVDESTFHCRHARRWLAGLSLFSTRPQTAVVCGAGHNAGERVDPDDGLDGHVEPDVGMLLHPALSGRSGASRTKRTRRIGGAKSA